LDDNIVDAGADSSARKSTKPGAIKNGDFRVLKLNPSPERVSLKALKVAA
jgi:hypothetical protein